MNDECVDESNTMSVKLFLPLRFSHRTHSHNTFKFVTKAHNETIVSRLSSLGPCLSDAFDQLGFAAPRTQTARRQKRLQFGCRFLCTCSSATHHSTKADLAGGR